MIAKCVLFDLDGTLTDPYQGITGSIRHALERLGAKPASEDDLRWCIGPPLSEGFARLLGHGKKADVERAIELYRERYRETGIYESRVYDGIRGLLHELTGRSTLMVATSKPTCFAERVLDHFDVRTYFTRVHGSHMDGRLANKGELIAHILEHEKLRASDCVMIGDREHDVLGARANGVTAFGALWGYGSERELLEAGASAVFVRPRDVIAALATGWPEDP